MTRSPSTTPPPSPRTPAPARSTCSPTTPTSTAARRRSPRSTQPDNGEVTVAGDGQALSYTPDPNYCNEGGPTDNFTYTLNGGSTATVAVTVTCAGDDPVAVDDAATVAEDSGASAINVLANDTDVDGGPKTITAVTQPDNGERHVAGDGQASATRPTPTTATRAARPTTSPTP